MSEPLVASRYPPSRLASTLTLVRSMTSRPLGWWRSQRASGMVIAQCAFGPHVLVCNCDVSCNWVWLTTKGR
jgi:hypothetical protein